MSIFTNVLVIWEIRGFRIGEVYLSHIRIDDDKPMFANTGEDEQDDAKVDVENDSPIYSNTNQL